MEKKKNQTTELPKWIQTRSWEVELLISGGAIISLLQFHDHLRIQIEKADTITFFQISGISESLIALHWLALYFALHLVTRAYWLSIVFLNKLFPDGHNVEATKLVEPYLTYNKRFDLAKQITTIDTLCSIIFCWAFISTLIIIGTYISFFILSLPSSLHSAFFLNFNFQLVVIPLIISFNIFLFDLFTFGLLRKNRFTAKLFLPIYWFWNKVSLGFIWRPNLELMFSKFKSKVAIAASVIIVFSVSLFIPTVFTNFLFIADQRKHSLSEILLDESNYMDKYSPEQWQRVTIQSDVITEEYVKIFIRYSVHVDKMVDEAKESNVSNIFKISINDSIYTKLQWVGITKMNGQKGIQTVVNIAHLENRMHLLKIEDKLNYDQPQFIPFWKE